jgi:hypothetical protein
MSVNFQSMTLLLMSFSFFYSIFFRLISLFTSHLGEHIRPKQRLALKSSAPIRSGSTLLNPSQLPKISRKYLFLFFHQVSKTWKKNHQGKLTNFPFFIKENWPIFLFSLRKYSIRNKKKSWWKATSISLRKI